MGQRRCKEDTRAPKSRSVEYRTWAAMLARCRNKNNPNYGGRGIRVCKRWRESFALFLKDMGSRPGPEYSIDRINNNAGYSKNNCRWATRKQQARNKCNNFVIEHNGEALTVLEWSERLGIKPATIIGRFIGGNSLERVFHVGKLKQEPRFLSNLPGWDALYRDRKRARQSRDKRKLLKDPKKP